MRIDFRAESRGYTLTLEADLLGSFILSRYWYGLRNNRGGTKRQVFNDETAAMRELDRIVKTRGRRGYARSPAAR